MSESKSNNGITVAVTGASGYVASVLIKHLINKGYNVRGSVRSLSNPEKTKHLTDTFPSLQLFEADLLVENSFSKMFKDCKFIFHTASPFQTAVKDPMKDLVEPAVNGTKNVISTALNTSGVQRIILTSSVAAVRRADKPADHVFTEADWNVTATIENAPYPYSKFKAEEAAWALVKEFHSKHNTTKPDLVVINPSLVLGEPVGSHNDSTSVKTVVNLLSGVFKDSGARNFAINAVDVNDIARAHIAAAETESASGRYIVSSYGSYTDLDYANILRKFYPDYPLPTKLAAPLPAGAGQQVSSAKAEKELGIKLTPIETSLKEMAAKLIASGAVQQKKA